MIRVWVEAAAVAAVRGAVEQARTLGGEQRSAIVNVLRGAAFDLLADLLESP